jgi:CheY-like chemotaxis protein
VDLVLLDVRMPVADGPRTCAVMQATPALAHIPVVFLTAEIFEHEHARLWALGPAAVLTKPIRRKDLLATLERVLGQLICSV